jgi:hypothetical protein
VITKIIYFPIPTPPRNPSSRIPTVWKFIALVVAYVRTKQQEFKLPLILPSKWAINRVLDVSIHGITTSDGDRVAGVRRAMEAKRPRMSIVDMAGDTGLQGVAA